MIQTGTGTEFVDAAIASGDIELMKGIANNVEDLSDTQIKGLLFSGSLEVATSMIGKLQTGSTIFGEIAQLAVSKEAISNGAIVKVVSEGVILNDFVTIMPSCEIDVETVQAVEVRYAMDNIARVIEALNLDALDFAAVTAADLILEIEKALISNQAAPEAVVTPYLVNALDVLRAKAFVHANTNNTEIVTVMTADDASNINIDAFKLAMIADLISEDMIQGNVEIVVYLVGATQSTPVKFNMFKNYTQVILNGGTVIPAINDEELIIEFMG